MIDFEIHGHIIDAVFEKYGINTPLRKSHFLAQIDHESNSLKTLTENLNYTSTALISLFSRSRISISDAEKYGRKGKKRADQQMIANIIYGGSFGRKNLGNTNIGDGWLFRGRGAIMCTGRTNYLNYGKYKGIDFISNPDLLSQSPFYLDFAGYYWDKKNINELADKDDVKAVSKAVNGGVIGLSERIILTNKYKKQYGFF